MKTKQVKQAEANERNMHWASLTDAQKLKELSERPGSSKKQVKKLTK